MLVGLALLATAPAYAQALPPELRNAGITVAQWTSVQAEVKRAASARGASERALASVAQLVGIELAASGAIDVDQVLDQIDSTAQKLAELQQRLEILERADDPQISSLLKQAHDAIDAGDVKRGAALLAQAAESDLAAYTLAQAQTAARGIRASKTTAEAGNLAFLTRDYLKSAELLDKAADIYQAAATSQPDYKPTLWGMRREQAFVLEERAEWFQEPDTLREAIRVMREEMLPLVPKASNLADWARTQNDLGTALSDLSDMDETFPVSESIAAYKAALEGQDRERDRTHWAFIQGNLSQAYASAGRLGDPDGYRNAVAAAKEALEVFASEADATNWSMASNALATAYLAQWEAGDEAAFDKAVATLVAVVDRPPGDLSGEVRAASFVNLGMILQMKGENDRPDLLHKALDAYAGATDAVSIDDSPMIWGMALLNAGDIYVDLAKMGVDDTALLRAIASYEMALRLFSPEQRPDLFERATAALADANSEYKEIQH